MLVGLGRSGQSLAGHEPGGWPIVSLFPLAVWRLTFSYWRFPPSFPWPIVSRRRAPHQRWRPPLVRRNQSTRGGRDTITGQDQGTRTLRLSGRLASSCTVVVWRNQSTRGSGQDHGTRSRGTIAGHEPGGCLFLSSFPIGRWRLAILGHRPEPAHPGGCSPSRTTPGPHACTPWSSHNRSAGLSAAGESSRTTCVYIMVVSRLAWPR